MQDKRNFQGGLNRDDDSRVLPNGDYFYAKNVRIVSSEDRSSQLLENLKGMEKEKTPTLTLPSFGSNKLDYRVIGSYEDKPKNCIYYFLYNKQFFHTILEYNVNTDTVSTVFRDNGEKGNDVLRFDKNTLITGINKIGDLLYWTSDNTYQHLLETRNNEPKYINVEMAKAGWAVYYDGGAFTINPTTAFDLETMYPFEFYTSSQDGNESVNFEKKLKYIDVCKTRPAAPIYFHQTPIKNVSSTDADLSTLTDGDGEALSSGTVKPGEVVYADASITSVEGSSLFDYAYNKNNLYGFMWQFAYRYIYKNNEVSAYSEWSFVLPAPQYYANKVDEKFQNPYNQIRVWYHNGPSDVDKIEIVARKCSYIETSPHEGNKGEYYLIATIENKYYDSSYSPSNNVSITGESGFPQYDYTSVTTQNVPYLTSMETNGSEIKYSKEPYGFINFRNDGVYSQVDPVAFDKLYDMVPKRAKAQELVNENRIIYGNYVDGFDQCNPHYHLSPIYNDKDAPYGEENFNPYSFTQLENGSWEGFFTEDGVTSGDGHKLASGFNDPNMNWLRGTNGDTNNGLYGTVGEDAMHVSDTTPYKHRAGGGNAYAVNTVDGEGMLSAQGLGIGDGDRKHIMKQAAWDVNPLISRVKIVFPTSGTSGDLFRIRVKHRERYRTLFGSSTAGFGKQSFYPFDWEDNGSNQDDATKGFKWFGYQIDLSRALGGGGMNELITFFINDIKAMANFDQVPTGGGLDDNRGTDFSIDPQTGSANTFYNPNHKDGDNPGKIYTTWMKNGGSETDSSGAAPGAHTYGWDGTQRQGAALMRLVRIRQEDTDFGTGNAIYMEFAPYGQTIASDGDGDNAPFPDDGCSTKRHLFEFGNANADGTGYYYPFGSFTPPYHSHSGGSTTNLHCWIRGSSSGWFGETPDDEVNSYYDSTECEGVLGSIGCGNFWAVDSSNLLGTRSGCQTDGDRYNAKYLEVEYDSENSSFDGAKGQWSPGGVWEIISTVNGGFGNMIHSANGAQSFKSGAFHRFGLVYYDYKGRSSTVMLNTEDVSETFERDSSCYVQFPPEKNLAQYPPTSFNANNPSGIVSSELGDGDKATPADVYWKIFHKPPIWARYYHWVYARNTSVAQFLQFSVDNAYVNKGAKAGVGEGEAENDTKIYISLNTMDGRDWSYSEKNRALIGDWSFAEGDRIRLISKGDLDADGTDDGVFDEYYDFKISDIGHFPGRFELGDDEDGIMKETHVVSNSPVGGAFNEPQSGVQGKFIILDDPKIPNYGIAGAEGQPNGRIPNWHKVVVEIYRPSKNEKEEETLYYEFAERMNIGDPGTNERFHQGPLSNQDGSVYDSNDKTLLAPAQGIFKRGDIWWKPREIQAVLEDGTALDMRAIYVESYFLNDFMQTNHNNIGRPNVFSTFAKEQRREATLTYSDVFQPDTQYNGLHSFNFSQRPYMDYDLSLGSIQKLVSRDTNLVMLQENKLSTILVNKSIITSPSGDEGISLSNNVLPETASPVAGEYGVSKNPESVAVEASSIYFADIKRGAILRLANNGLTVISDYKMTDYFRDKMDQYQQILESEYEEKLGGGLFIIGGFDRRHKEYVISFPPTYKTTKSTSDKPKKAFFNTNSQVFQSETTTFNTLKTSDKIKTSFLDKDLPQKYEINGRELDIDPETIAFHEPSNRWSSFYTYYPEYYGALNRTFISFKDGHLYKHDMDSNWHNQFYEYPFAEESEISFPFNADVSTVKTFNSISLEGPSKYSVIPILTVASSSGPATITATTGSANLEGSNVNLTSSSADIKVGDEVFYNDNGTFRTLGVITALTDSDTIVTSVDEVNAFITASTTSSGDALEGVFIVSAEKSAYNTKLETNMNSTELVHRLSYNNSATTYSGSWVDREDVLSTHISNGTTNTSGGEYFGIGHVSSDNGNEEIFGSTTWAALVGGLVQGTTTNTTFTSAGINIGDSIYYDNNGTETLIGVIDTINEDRMITLESNATTSLANTFMFVKKNSTIEGDRLKGNYMDATLTKRSKDKIHLFAANANVINSELSNK